MIRIGTTSFYASGKNARTHSQIKKMHKTAYTESETRHIDNFV